MKKKTAAQCDDDAARVGRFFAWVYDDFRVDKVGEDYGTPTSDRFHDGLTTAEQLAEFCRWVHARPSDPPPGGGKWLTGAEMLTRYLNEWLADNR
jgi:hypothetical protein